MTSVLLDTRPQIAAEDDPGTYHLVCCEPDTALCGTDVSDIPYGPLEDEQWCAVCWDLADVDVSCGASMCSYGDGSST